MRPVRWPIPGGEQHRDAAGGQHADRIEEVRGQFRRHGWQIIVIGRLLPASAIGSLLWAIAYAALGVLSGGIFDSPLLATLLATLLVLLVAGVLNLVSSRRRRARAGTPERCEST